MPDAETRALHEAITTNKLPAPKVITTASKSAAPPVPTPAASNLPPIFNVRLFDQPNAEDAIHRSKAVGEPPLMLALSVFFALRDAVAAALGPGARPPLVAPATPEAVLRALHGGSLP